jgi:predicted  nucleic acid-binding Zn-ribbon protein
MADTDKAKDEAAKAEAARKAAEAKDEAAKAEAARKAAEAKDEAAKADQAAAIARRDQRRKFRGELKYLQERSDSTIVVRPGTSAINAAYLSKDDLLTLKEQGRERPRKLDAKEQHRLWELHYLGAGLPVPIREDLDD